MGSDGAAAAGGGGQDASTETHEDRWLDGFARRLGFGWLARRLPWAIPPSYLYAVTTIVTFTTVSTAYDLAVGATPIYTENPYFLLQPVALVAAVYAARSLHGAYDGVMAEMRVAERASDPEPLLELVPARLPWALFGVAATLQLVRAVLDASAFDTTGLVANFVIFPFVYAPILVQFIAVYVGIEFLAPWRLSRSDVGIHFLDPEGVGGLRPLGELIKRAYYWIVGGLVVYALITYAPFITKDWTVSAVAGTIFTAVWVGTVATVAFAVFTLHRFMHREKRAEIRDLEAQLREHIENPWDVQSYDVPEGKERRVSDLRDRIDRVSATSEYPATFNIWSQLLLSIAIPKALQVLLASV